MQLGVIKECVRDAKGTECHTIGQLLYREMAIMAIQRAKDHLAMRQALHHLFEVMGWPWSRYMLTVTKR